MYENDHRIVMTLDAGGTNFVFSAIRGCREIVAPVRLDAVNDDIARCLDALVAGFEAIEKNCFRRNLRRSVSLFPDLQTTKQA